MKTSRKDNKRTMKTIKPKAKNVIINSEPVKNSNNLVVNDTKLSINTNLIQDEPRGTIEDLMNSVLKENNYKIDPNKVKVELYLTKRQYDLYTKKGGESWLKKALIGQGNKRKKEKIK
jgi:hypothetical protein